MIEQNALFVLILFPEYKLYFLFKFYQLYLVFGKLGVCWWIPSLTTLSLTPTVLAVRPGPR